MVVQGTLQLTATLQDSTGNVLTGRTITWTSLDPSAATVSISGRVTALKVGAVTVQAASEGKSGTVTLTLAPVVTITRRLPSLFSGDTTLLVAKLTDANGATLVLGLPVQWDSRNVAVATVTGGIVDARTAGNVRIVASLNGASDSVEVVSLTRSLGTNREIAFLRTVNRTIDGLSIEELWSMDLSGGGLTRITPMDQTVTEFVWSPDGSKIAAVFVTHNFHGESGIFVMGADGANPVRVGDGVALRWSPDGNKITYRTHKPAIAVANADGSGSIDLTSGVPGELDPDWSPDGRQIAYRVQTFFCDQLWVMNADGTNQHQVLIPSGMCVVRWSPDGKQLAFTSPATGSSGTNGIWVVNDDGTGVISVSNNCTLQGVCSGPWFWDLSWSTDGNRLGFTMNGNTLHFTDRYGGNLLEFQLPPSSTRPLWSPDGTLILFQGVAATGPAYPSIGVVGVNGVGATLITSGFQATSPAWRP
jgi:hypothetical protein